MADTAGIREWTARHLASARPDAPFSFVYDGRKSGELLSAWRFSSGSAKLDSSRTRRVLTWRDPNTGLELRCVAVEYSDYPAIEWTLYLKNTGRADTPVVQDLRAMDSAFVTGEAGPLTIHTIRGDNCTPDSYEPVDTPLAAGGEWKTSAVRGRPTQVNWPYWNVEMGGRGLILACGWPGQWSAAFSRGTDGTLRVTAGQETTHFRLHPGEEVRSPLMVLMFYTGDHVSAQNLWRRWMLAHNAPRVNGEPPKAILASCATGFFPGLIADEKAERAWMEKFETEGVKLDYWWIDAGWYPLDPKVGWPCTGTWEVDRTRYPGGLRAVSDYAHSRGMKLIVWHEPERVHPGTWLSEEHPEWVSGGKQGGLLDLGNPECLKWAIDHFDRLIKDNGIDLYRQDFNMDPLDAWRAKDAPDRQGITENKHVMGYLAFWDELRKRNPHILIDSCASGGRRNDLETLRRSLPLLRSDYQSFAGDSSYAVGNQGHTYGLSFWVPYYGQGCYWSTDHYIYCARSYLSPSMGLACDVRNDKVDWAEVRKAASDAMAMGDLMLTDYYPLTPYSLDESRWMAWQFDSPERGEGFVSAFRRANSQEASMNLKLRGLRPEACYEVRDRDHEGIRRRYNGRQLMDQGLPVTMESKPQAVVLTYKRVD